jgi:hypothetical protein
MATRSNEGQHEGFPFEDMNLCMAAIPFFYVFICFSFSPFASAVFVESLSWFRDWLQHRI